MLTATRECPKCGGSGFRPLLGPLFTRCRPCKGSGVQIKMSHRIWSRLRYGSGDE